MEHGIQAAQAGLETGEAFEGTLVELVVALCDTTEDETELADRLDAGIASGRFRIHRLA